MTSPAIDVLPLAGADLRLGHLFDRVGTAESTCRSHWEKNPIALWDDRCTRHRAVADSARAHRRMERVTIEGGRPR